MNTRNLFIITTVAIVLNPAISPTLLFGHSAEGKEAAYDVAYDLLANIESANSRLRNYQCKSTIIHEMDYESRLKQLQRQKNSKYTTPTLIEQLRANLKKTGKRACYQRIVADSQESVLLDQIEADYQSDTTWKSIRRNITSWDGTTSIGYGRAFEMVGKGISANAVISDERPRNLDLALRPRASLQECFIRFYTAALKEKREVSVTKLEKDSLWSVQFDSSHLDGLPGTYVGIIDPAMGYAVIKWSVIKGDKTIRDTSIDYEEINGVWFPVKGRQKTWYSDDGKLACTIKFTVTDVVINDPGFDEGLFDVDLPIGTYVEDMIAGVKFFVGQAPLPEMADISSEIRKIDVDAASDKDLEKTGKSIRTAYIPCLDFVNPIVQPFILDLDAGAIFGIDTLPQRHEVAAKLKGIGKSCLFWDGSLVATGDLALKARSGNQGLKKTKIDNAVAYSVDKELLLPYSFEMINKNQDQYRISLDEIADAGIYVSFQKLD